MSELISSEWNRLYFAHPVSDYGWQREKRCIELIASSDLRYMILVNPNQPEHNEAYKTEGMGYFERLVGTCGALVAVPFPDGEWGMGVWREAETMAEKGGEVYELNPEKGTLVKVDYQSVRPLSIVETRKRVKDYTPLEKKRYEHMVGRLESALRSCDVALTAAKRTCPSELREMNDRVAADALAELSEWRKR